MRKTGFTLTTLFVLSGMSAQALEATNVSAEQDAASSAQTIVQQFDPRNDLADATPNCRKVEVVLDEGYGVTGHATRDECPPKRR